MATDSPECTLAVQGVRIADPDAPADVNGGIVRADGRDRPERDVVRLF